MQTQFAKFMIEQTFTLSSEKELLESFNSRDQDKLILPANLQFPMQVRSYFTWKEPSGVYTYLIYKSPAWDQARGVAFKRTAPPAEMTGGLCNWCNSYGPSDEIGMLSLNMNSKVSLSYFLCQDLRCIEKIEEECLRSGKQPEKYVGELYKRVEKLFENRRQYNAEL